jgi:hypothetical protein
LKLPYGDLGGVTLNHSGNVCKSKYIKELHAAQLFNSPTTLIYSSQLHGATPQKAVKLMARRKPMNAKEITINFRNTKAVF